MEEVKLSFKPTTILDICKAKEEHLDILIYLHQDYHVLTTKCLNTSLLHKHINIAKYLLSKSVDWD